jgi:hypothetical protein
MRPLAAPLRVVVRCCGSAAPTVLPAMPGCGPYRPRGAVSVAMR